MKKTTNQKNKNPKSEKVTHPTIYIGFSDEEASEQEQQTSRNNIEGNQRRMLTRSTVEANRKKPKEKAQEKSSKEEIKLIGKKRKKDSSSSQDEKKAKTNFSRQKVEVEKTNEQKNKLVNKKTASEFSFAPCIDEPILKKKEIRDKLELDNFKKSLIDFLNISDFKIISNNFDKTIFSYNTNKLQSLFRLFNFVNDNGGFEHVVGNLLLEKFINENELTESYASVRTDYNKFLYHYSEYLKSKSGQTKTTFPEIAAKDPSMLLEVKVITCLSSDNEEKIREKINESLKYDLVILRDFLPQFKLDNDKFSIKYLKENCNIDQKIDVIEQSPSFYGFNPNRHSRKQMTLRKYLQYVEEMEKERLVQEKSNFSNSNKINVSNLNSNNNNCSINSSISSFSAQNKNELNQISQNLKIFKNSSIKNNNINISSPNNPTNPISEKENHSPQHSKNHPPSKNNKTKNKNSTIFYGVNVELNSYPDLFSELESQIHPLLLFGSSYDSLAYVRQHIDGMTVPQMYIKVKDVWTGGHEENLRMRSINISHGPGESLWWGAPIEDSKKIVEVVQEKFNFNIYKKEGIWFPNNDFFYSNKIRFYHTIQKPGDIILVGPGALHWVKARSHSINTSWNFSHKDSNSLKMSMDRYEINKKIKFKSLVPMHTLILDILNQSLNDLTSEFVSTCNFYLKPTIEEAINEYEGVVKEYLGEGGNTNKLKMVAMVAPQKINLMKEPENYIVLHCEECNDELFNLWGYCDGCSTKSKQVVLCMHDFKKHKKTCIRPDSIIFYKYDVMDLKELQSRINFKIKYNSTPPSSTAQTGLIKKTKDSSLINRKKQFKIDIPSFFNRHELLYKEIDVNEVSCFLEALIDHEKFTTGEYKSPLDLANEVYFYDPYTPCEDFMEDINSKRFSPNNYVEYNPGTEINKDYPDEWNNKLKINFDEGYFENLGDGYMHVEEPSPLPQMEIKSSTNSYANSYLINNNISPQFNNFMFNNSIRHTSGNFALKKTSGLFNVNMPGQSLLSALENKNDRNERNFNLKSDALSSSHKSEKSNQSFNNQFNDEIFSRAGLDTKISERNRGKNITNIYNQYNQFNSYESVRELKNFKTSLSKEIPPLENNFKIKEPLQSDSSAVPYDPFMYRSGKNNDSKSMAINQLRKAKTMLSQLTDRESAKLIKLVSPTEHKIFFAGKKIILDLVDAKEALEETKMKAFIERIIKNDNLIQDYKTMFEEEIYSKI